MENQKSLFENNFTQLKFVSYYFKNQLPDEGIGLLNKFDLSMLDVGCCMYAYHLYAINELSLYQKSFNQKIQHVRNADEYMDKLIALAKKENARPRDPNYLFTRILIKDILGDHLGDSEDRLRFRLQANRLIEAGIRQYGQDSCFGWFKVKDFKP